jgi:hypothetical protein
MADLKNTDLGAVLQRARTITHETVWRAVLNDGMFRNWILDLVRQKQLFQQGVDENNDIIGVYSELTELIKPEKKAGTPYTLYDTGEFYKSMFIIVFADSFIIDADPLKRGMSGQINLFDKYGEGIVGLTEESKTILADEFQRRTIIEYTKLLQINR